MCDLKAIQERARRVSGRNPESVMLAEDVAVLLKALAEAAERGKRTWTEAVRQGGKAAFNKDMVQRGLRHYQALKAELDEAEGKLKALAEAEKIIDLLRPSMNLGVVQVPPPIQDADRLYALKDAINAFDAILGGRSE